MQGMSPKTKGFQILKVLYLKMMSVRLVHEDVNSVGDLQFCFKLTTSTLRLKMYK